MRIERTNSHRMLALFSSAGLAAGLFLMLMVFCGAARAPAQPSVHERHITALQSKLRVAVEQHVSPEQQGLLWHSLGVAYENGFDYDNAEDAFAHAIHLLRDTAAKKAYAESLHQTGDIFVMQGRLKEARNSLAQARGVFEELGDKQSVALVRGSIALALLCEHKFPEAETEASATIAALESAETYSRVDLENAYMIRARAIAGEGRPEKAFEDIAHARTVVANDPTANEVDRIAILLAQGELQMQVGRETEGTQSMTEALKRARALTGLPPTTSALFQASILEREVISMRKAHHKDDAKVLEDQRKQALTAARAGCGGCTVSVNSLLAR